jgi:hypothetical protein
VRFLISIAVWGGHIDTFREHCLPSLPGAIKGPGVRLVFHTTERDAPLLRELGEIRLIDDTSDKFAVVGSAHRAALQMADEEDAVFVPIAPDTVLAAGTFAHAIHHLQRGKRVVHLPSIRLNKDTVPKLAGLSGREFVALGLRHLHPVARCHFWSFESDRFYPSNIYWRAPYGLLAHCFHMHPLMIWPRVKFAESHSTEDDDMALACCPDLADHHVVTDSGDAAQFELSAPDACSIHPEAWRRREIADVVDWALSDQHTNRLHRWLALHPCRMRSNGLGDWLGAEKRAARTMAEIIEALPTC